MRSKANLSPMWMLFIVLMVGAAPRASLAQDIHVAPVPVGSDSGDGTLDAPLARIQAAIDLAGEDDGGRVVLLPGVYSGPGNRDINFKGRPLVVMGRDGAGRTVIDCERAGRGFVFNSGEDGRSLVEGVTIRNGFAPFSGNLALGGGIYCSDASPTFRKCLVQDCLAQGQFNFGTSGGSGLGGGVYLRNSSARFEQCTITRCRSEGAVGQGFLGGGGIANGAGLSSEGGAPVLSGCVLTRNECQAGPGSTPGTANGGAIYLLASGATIEQTLIIENTVLGGNDGQGAGRGAGIFAERSPAVVVRECEFIRNVSLPSGGPGFFMSGTGGNVRIEASTFHQNIALRAGGGTIEIAAGTLTLVNTTIAANSVIPLDGIGCGLRVTGGEVAVTNCTFSENSGGQGAGGVIRVAGRVRLLNNIFAFNKPRNLSGTISSQGGNLSTDSGGGLVPGADMLNSDPLLGPLALNGGVTRTLALPSASPAIDAGINTGSPSRDQRGVRRPADGNGDGYSVTDPGAFELPRPRNGNGAEFSEFYE